MNFEGLKNALISAAERAGIKEYEIYAQVVENLSAETLKDEISSFSSSVGGGICFRCIVDGKMGYAATQECDPTAMETVVASAVSNAKCIDSTDEVMIYPGSKEYAKAEGAEVSLCDAMTVRDNALRLQREVYATDSRVADGTQSGAFSEVMSIHLYNSYGLSLSNRVGVSGSYAEAVVREGEEAQEAFDYAVGTAYEDLSALPKKVVKTATEKLGAESVPSGSYDVLFSGNQFRSFLSAFSSPFSAKRAQQGLSLLAGKEGERIASEIVSIVDDPMPAHSPMKAPFDGEGVATAKKNVVENGVLKTLLYDLTTAKKAGVESTGNGQKGSYSSPVGIAPYHFSILAGEDSEEALLEAIGDGIYITECKGFHAGANAVTGDFSIESAGFRIRGGKRAEPIKSFTVSGNFFDLLKRIDRLGDTVCWGLPGGFTVYGSPDVLVRGMGIAGK